LSTASINRLIIPAANSSDRVRILAVASRDDSTARKYAHEWGLERWYGSYDELLDDPDIEALYISLPNSLHVDWSIRAAEAGKHVLCEKPLSRYSSDAERAFDAAEQNGVFLMEAFMYRHSSQTRRLEELVRSGVIGEVRIVRSTLSFSLSNPLNIRLRSDLDGGALMDVGAYCVNGARLLAGEPLEVYGEQVIGATGVDVLFAGMMRFADDVIAQFECGFVLPSRDGLEVVGSGGTLSVKHPWDWETPEIELRGDRDVECIKVEPQNPYRLELENLSGAIRGKELPLLGRADGLGQARTIEALYQSARERRPVQLG